MLRASVLIPTHEHAATLPFAVKSVLVAGYRRDRNIDRRRRRRRHAARRHRAARTIPASDFAIYPKRRATARSIATRCFARPGEVNPSKRRLPKKQVAAIGRGDDKQIKAAVTRATRARRRLQRRCARAERTETAPRACRPTTQTAAHHGAR
jgi:hypothetical protein